MPIKGGIVRVNGGIYGIYFGKSWDNGLDSPKNQVFAVRLWPKPI